MSDKELEKKQRERDVEGINNLLFYEEEYPEGVIKIGYHYYPINGLTSAIKDIQLRALMGAETKADILLLSILAGLR